eukprot:2448984-Rhodomonas_salina.2
MNSPHRLLKSESPARGDNAKMKDQQGVPLARIKSFGELSSGEYQELVSALWESAQKGDVRQCADLVKQKRKTHAALLAVKQNFRSLATFS